ncbi:MAG: shikimate kinase [Candidatus Omnitrophota bacterium]
MVKVGHIYLVGFMGTGKSVVGRALAAKLSRNFVDLDSLIEEREGARIKDIFSDKGEDYFRELERRFLQEVSWGWQRGRLVVSCGGGVVLNEENISLMKSAGLLVCLWARPQVILDRISGCPRRPLLPRRDARKKIEELLHKRTRFYSRADYTIDTSDKTIEEVVERIICYLPTRSPGWS